MKRNVLLFSLFAAVILLFASCTPEAGMLELSPDDIQSSWVDGYWTGTVTTTIDDNNPVETDASGNYTEAMVKAICNKSGSAKLGNIGAEIECSIYTNLTKTKMNIVVKSKTTFLDKTSTTTVRYQLTKQKD